MSLAGERCPCTNCARRRYPIITPGVPSPGPGCAVCVWLERCRDSGLSALATVSGRCELSFPRTSTNTPRMPDMPNGLPANWRPFIQQSIDELETIVAQNRGNIPVLLAVLAELENRSTQRARSLHSRLERQLSRDGTQGVNGTLPAPHLQLPSEVSRGRGAPQAIGGDTGPGRPMLPSGAPSDHPHESWASPAATRSSRGRASLSSAVPEWLKVVAGVGVLLVLYRVVFG